MIITKNKMDIYEVKETTLRHTSFDLVVKFHKYPFSVRFEDFYFEMPEISFQV